MGVAGDIYFYRAISFRVVLNLGVMERMKRDCLEKPDISGNL